MKAPLKVMACPKCSAAGYWYFDGMCEGCFNAHTEFMRDQEVLLSVMRALRESAILRDQFAKLFSKE